MFVGDFAPGSPEWHAARAQGLGGSEIAAVLGLSPWESRFSLWHRKTGTASPVVENDIMYWGKA
ncbi:MAG: YqaJ viral recombinase family protein, partial [Actinomycetota bacterium]|nr:YqaJ viral recombinase family protein [Actinomycetota bacterium]